MTSAPSANRPAPAKRDRTASAFLAAVLLAAALTGMSTFTVAGREALHGLLRFVGIERMQQEQQRQALALAELERVTAVLSTELGGLGIRAAQAESKHTDLDQRLAQLDGQIGGLREAMAKRPKLGDTPGTQAWRETMYQSDRVLHGALMDLASLRSSFDTNEVAQRKEIAALNKRLERLESAIARPEVASAARRRAADRKAASQAGVAGHNLEFMAAPSPRGMDLGAVRRTAP
jgi:septal ring factor EnvC (AmiA/AmiB activator)